MALPMAGVRGADFGLDELLLDVCDELQITEEQEARARSAYGAVGDWLGGIGSPLRSRGVRIYAQGSLALRTTTKPRGTEEYDLDLVCEVTRSPSEPQALYDLVLARLREHGDYAKRIVEKKRCVRLDYAGDFHLDVLPGRPDADGAPNAIDIPDTARELWHPTNPIEFVKWFEQQVRRERSRLVKAMQAPLPDSVDPRGAGPLRNSVQLLKRYRDNRFYRATRDVAPRSIVLTTLSGELYDGGDSLTSTFAGIAIEMLHKKRDADARGHRLVVMNPVANREDFSERWADPANYDAFDQMLTAMAIDIERVRAAKGLSAVSKILDEMFGDDLGVRSIDRYSRRLQGARDRKVLGSTVAGSLSASVRRSSQPHTFHHD